MPEILFIPLLSLIVLLTCIISLWLWSIKLNNASIIDIFWGPACAIPVWVAFVLSHGYQPRKLLLFSLVTIWSLRLALHLGKRNIGHGEDPRYTAMRAAAPSDINPHLFTLKKVFLLQGVIAWAISLPAQLGVIYQQPQQLSWLAMAGTLIFCIGLFFEAVGDHQLKQFKSKTENKGRLMTSGLWAWTRHPNYFGDAAIWFGLTIIALENPIGLIGIYSPFLMLFFLTKVTGKSLLEKGMRERYSEYDEYVRTTSGFFPRPPRK